MDCIYLLESFCPPKAGCKRYPIILNPNQGFAFPYIQPGFTESRLAWRTHPERLTKARHSKFCPNLDSRILPIHCMTMPTTCVKYMVLCDHILLMLAWGDGRCSPEHLEDTRLRKVGLVAPPTIKGTDLCLRSG